MLNLQNLFSDYLLSKIDFDTLILHIRNLSNKPIESSLPIKPIHLNLSRFLTSNREFFDSLRNLLTFTFLIETSINDGSLRSLRVEQLALTCLSRVVVLGSEQQIDRERTLLSIYSADHHLLPRLAFVGVLSGDVQENSYRLLQRILDNPYWTVSTLDSMIVDTMVHSFFEDQSLFTYFLDQRESQNLQDEMSNVPEELLNRASSAARRQIFEYDEYDLLSYSLEGGLLDIIESFWPNEANEIRQAGGNDVDIEEAGRRDSEFNQAALRARNTLTSLVDNVDVEDTIRIIDIVWGGISGEIWFNVLFDMSHNVPIFMHNLRNHNIHPTIMLSLWNRIPQDQRSVAFQTIYEDRQAMEQLSERDGYFPLFTQLVESIVNIPSFSFELQNFGENINLPTLLEMMRDNQEVSDRLSNDLVLRDYFIRWAARFPDNVEILVRDFELTQEQEELVSSVIPNRNQVLIEALERLPRANHNR